MPETAPSISESDHHHSRREIVGLLDGLLAVFFFALTLPMSRYAVREVDPISTGLFRCALAGTLAAAMLVWTRSPLPTRRQLKGLAAASPGIVYVYPFFVAWAMKYTNSSHGSIVVGLLPLATAAAAGWLGYDRPNKRFWVAAVAGSLVVVAYALYHGGGGVHAADLALVFAVLCSGIAYAEGGWLARSMGGWQVIAWVMALNLPLVLPMLAASIWVHGFHPSAGVWAVLIFMGVFNQFVGFFGWYKAMAYVGVARVSQLQLLQPFMTVVIAAVFLDEFISWDTWLALALVLGTVGVARRAAKRG
jgi:drug/metabolite transporter (DMT)-like permease